MGDMVSIDISSRCIRMAQISKNGQKFKIQNLVRLDIPENLVVDGYIRDITAVAQRIAPALKEHQIKSRKAVFTLSSSKAVTKEVTVPVSEPKKIQQFITAKARDYFPLNMDDYALSYLLLEKDDKQGAGRPPKKKKVIKDDPYFEDEEQKVAAADAQAGPLEAVPQHRIAVIAIPKKVVDSYYALSKVLKFSSVKIDYAGNSCGQFSRLIAGEGRTEMVLHIMDDSTYVSMIDNGILKLQRVLNYGVESLVDSVSQQYSMDYRAAREFLMTKNILGQMSVSDMMDNELARVVNQMVGGVRRIVDFYDSKYPENAIQKLHITGSGADIPGLSQYHEDSIELPVEAEKEFRFVDYVKPTSDYPLNQFSAAIGAVILPIDVMTDEMLEQKKGANATFFAIELVVLAIITALVVTAIPFTKSHYLNLEKERLERELTSISDISDTVDQWEMLQFKSLQIANYLSSTRANTEYINDIINTFKDSLPTNCWVTSMTSDNTTISISFVADSKETAAKCVEVLKGLPYFSSVSINSVTNNTTGASGDEGEKVVVYAVQCTFLNQEVAQ